MKFENLNENVVKEISRNEPEWFANQRLISLGLFNGYGEDSFSYGMTMKTDVSDIKISDFSSKFSLIIKNEDENVVILNFNEAFQDYEEIIKSHFMKEVNSKIDLLHKAIFQNGIFIYVPKNKNVKEPIILNYEFLDNNSFDHLLVIIDENSSVDIIEILKNGENIFRNGFTEIYAKDNSKINFFSLQNLDKSVNNFSTKRSYVGKDAECNFHNFEFGGKINYSQIFSRLLNNGASSRINGIYFSDEKQHFNLGYNSIHESNNTFSNILTKGILDDESNTIYRGLVKIKDNASNSNGYQKEDTLILNNMAKADSIPNLEIDNNEVKCSHGASIGHLDKDKMFYLMSRGIPERSCIRIMIEAFFSEITDKIDNGILLNELTKIINSKIKDEY